MSSRTVAGEAAKPGGVFDRLGDVVVRWPLLVIAAWIAFAGLLALTLPPLIVAAGDRPPKALPDDAPTMITTQEMGKAFDGGKIAVGSLVMVVLTDEKGITGADENTYRKLIDTLHQDTRDKMSVQEFISTPAMRDVLASKDGKAINLPISFPGAPADAETIAAYKHVKEIAKQATTGTTLNAYVSGPVATQLDAMEMAERDAHVIEIGTVVSVLIILFIIYRNVMTMFVPLINIGASIATSQGVLSGLAKLGMAVNLQSIILMTAVMVGAGTDYAVFLISRYHDYVRHGQDSDQAVRNALMSIGKVIAASAATVAVTFLAMVFTKLEVFSAVGPAISVSIMVSLLAALTLLPALLVLAGRRGWIKPRRDLTTRFWRRTGTRVVRKTRVHLIGSLAVLIVLAACTLVMRFNYDDLKTMPESVDSSKGYDAMTRHFPMNLMTPMVLFIKSPRDLRTPTLLADLEQMANRVSQLPDITSVRGLTRPNGDPLEQTKVSYQAGEVGNKLDDASDQIQNHGSDLDRLVDGSNQLADALAQIRDQVTSAVSGLSVIVGPLKTMEELMGGDKTISALDQGAQFTGNMKSLGDNLSTSTVNAATISAWAGPMLTALKTSPECDADIECVNSRAGLAALIAANNDGTLASIKALARSLQATQEAQTIRQTLDKIQQTLTQASTALKTMRDLQSTLSQMQQGANALADGSRAIAGGVTELVKQTKNIGTGLNKASQFLLNMKHDAEKPSMAGFNIPAEFMTRDEFKQGAQIFISPDGHAARYLIQSAIDPFTTEAMDQIERIIKAADSAKPNTDLSDASVSVAGIPSGLKDTRDYYNNDIKYIVFATIIIVFFILVVLLRAIVAPVYLIGSVLLSYLSAMGLGVLVFQLILGKNLHWSLPGLAFILLVAVGADYNMLLISRIRDESPHGVRVGVIRTVGSTGGMITSAGLIFAASMFGLMSASIYTMAEGGFILGMGILIDTFLVRTITVPALAAMIGQKNWWPSQLGKSPAEIHAAREAKQRQLQRISDQLVRMKAVPRYKTHAPAPPVTTHKNDDPKRTPGSRSPGSQPARSRVTKNGKASVDRRLHHALPLFDLSDLPDHLASELQGSTSGSPSTVNGKRKHKAVNGNSKNKTDCHLEHSLPLFGQDVLSYRSIVIRSNGNGCANGNGQNLVDQPEVTDKSVVT